MTTQIKEVNVDETLKKNNVKFHYNDVLSYYN